VSGSVPSEVVDTSASGAASAGRYRVYVMDVSYFSGKFEAYLRYKGIPWQRIDVDWRRMQELQAHTGMMRVPTVLTPAGEWLQDSTPMIDWFERRHPEPAVLPSDPYQAFFCRLLEDYADEWLWRPALHYRWSHKADARLLGDRIAREVLAGRRGPHFLKAAVMRRRQYRTYVRRDGVTSETRVHVEALYLATLDRLERILSRHPFLLGDRPALVDFGFFASMFRHFSLDPTPSRIMRDRAPRVYSWVARLWNARAGETTGPWVASGSLPEGWEPFLLDLGAAYLPYLHANAVAYREGKRRLDYSVHGVTFRQVPAVRYRVWCRERLQRHYEDLPKAEKPRVEETLRQYDCWEPLWRDGTIESHLHDETAEPALCPPVRRTFLGRFGSADPWNPRPAKRRR
jgi:glutathione S-transferase